MARSKTQCRALSVGQLASRWGLSADRVRRLLDSGRLPGAFKVPSAGKYGEAIRIPLATILKAEEKWAIGTGESPQQAGLPHRGRGGSPAALRHFPELSSEHDAECREAGRR